MDDWALAMHVLAGGLHMTTNYGPPTHTYLNREQAAAYINARVPVSMSAAKLASRASEGNGPPYRLWGGAVGGRGRYAVYSTPDLDAWIEAQFSDAGTADAASSRLTA